MVRRIGFLVVVCLLTLAGWWWLRPRTVVDLASLVDRAGTGPLFGPTTPVGDRETQMFVGAGWEDSDRHRWLSTTSDAAELRFYLLEPTRVNILLEGDCDQPRTGTVELNGKSLGGVDLRAGPARFTATAEPGQTRPGENLLVLKIAPGTRWRGLSVTVAGNSPASLAREKDEVLLPFGQCLEIPAEGGMRLELEQLRPWLEEGAPPLEGWQLRLSGAAEAALEGPGPHRQTLTPGALRLTAVTEAPISGQLGLRFRGRLVRFQAPPPPAPPVVLPPAQTESNVLIYVVDTLRADALGCYNSKAHTPNFDALAKDGVLFYQAQAAAGWTKPAVASILTGLPAREHGCQDYGDTLRSGVTRLPEPFQADGYRTRAVVANDFISTAAGFGQGFAQFDLRSGASARELHEAVFEWLEKPGKFFLYLHTLEPHSPYAPEGQTAINSEQLHALARDASYRDPTVPTRLEQARALYAAEVEANDLAFGQLLAYLKAKGLYDNTLIVLVSDHGEEFLEHGSTEHGQSLYQEVLRVPAIVKLPGQAMAGQRIDGLFTHIDVAPTVLAWTGHPVPEQMQGRVFTGAALPPVGQASLRLGPDLAALNPAFGQIDLDAVREEQFVLIRTRASAQNRLQPLELYDLLSDPEQKHNLAFERPGLRARLELLLPPGTQASPANLPKAELERQLRSLQYL
ncbi:MAG: sulfatase [Vulcanimicrobiota bacterium]